MYDFIEAKASELPKGCYRCNPASVFNRLRGLSVAEGVRVLESDALTESEKKAIEENFQSIRKKVMFR